jgi:hypothetical protein
LRGRGNVLLPGGGKWIPPCRTGTNKYPGLSGTFVKKESAGNSSRWISIKLKARILLIRLLGFGNGGNKNEG